MDGTLLESVWHRLFAPGARPHVFGVNADPDAEWLLDPANLEILRQLRVGPVVFFENLYTGEQSDSPKGHVPIDGHYEYRNPQLIGRAMAAVRMFGCQVAGYMHGPAWRDAGNTPIQALAEIKSCGWEVVYLDNSEFGRTWLETLDFRRRLHALGIPVIEHCSVEPHLGYRAHRGPWAPFDSWTRKFETGPQPDSIHDPMWLYGVSEVSQGGKSVGIFKPTGDWVGNPEVWMPYQPELACICWLTRAPNVMNAWLTHYWPAYLRACKEYQADPAAFVERVMKKWR